MKSKSSVVVGGGGVEEEEEGGEGSVERVRGKERRDRRTVWCRSGESILVESVEGDVDVNVEEQVANDALDYFLVPRGSPTKATLCHLSFCSAGAPKREVLQRLADTFSTAECI